MIDPTTPVRLGRRGVVTVSHVGLGCAPIGNLFSTVAEHDAMATVRAARARGITLFDTAPQYGHGRSEERVGRALLGDDAVVITTKVGRLLQRTEQRAATIFTEVDDLDPVFDFSRDGVLRSLDDSLRRLGRDRIALVHVHDPDDHEHDALDEAFPTLFELRDQGVIGAVGCGMNQPEMLTRFVERLDLDAVLVAGRYTLLDRSAQDHLLPACAARHTTVMAAGVFNSGILADPHDAATFDYFRAAPEMLDRARRLATVCTRYGTDLPTASLQFPFRHPDIGVVLIGARSEREINDNLDRLTVAVDPDLWPALDAALEP